MILSLSSAYLYPGEPLAFTFITPRDGDDPDTASFRKKIGDALRVFPKLATPGKIIAITPHGMTIVFPGVYGSVEAPLVYTPAAPEYRAVAVVFEAAGLLTLAPEVVARDGG